MIFEEITKAIKAEIDSVMLNEGLTDADRSAEIERIKHEFDFAIKECDVMLYFTGLLPIKPSTLQ